MYARIHEYLRYVTSQNRETLRVGPFMVMLSTSDNPFLNYAIPDDGGIATAADIEALIAAFEQRQRKPRLEYISQLAPAIEPALMAASFVVEGQLPLMLCTARPSLPIPVDIELIQPTTDDELAGMLLAQNEAYGGGAPTPEEIQRIRTSLDHGHMALFARTITSHEPVGGGMCTPIYAGVTEVAGIGVREHFRRRGVAAVLTARLVQLAFDAGAEQPFLMAAGTDEARIYTRAGFESIGTILHISRPTAA